MALTLRYSLQNSQLKPSGVTGQYARLQVDYRPEQESVTISDSDYKILIKALSEGRLIGLQTENGIRLGQFITGLAGGVVVNEFKTATRDDVRVSFKSSQRFLKDTRALVSFERVPTVTSTPSIISFTYIPNNGSKKQMNQISLDHSAGVITIKGLNFIKDGMTAEIVQYIDGIMTTTPLPIILNSGTKKLDILFTTTSTAFVKGKMTPPNYTRLILKRTRNPLRLATFDFVFVGS